MNSYLTYWKNETVRTSPPGLELRVAGSAHYRRVSAGDTIWFVTYENARAFLIGRIEVEEVLSKEHARRRFSEGELWDSSHYIVARPETVCRLRRIDLTPSLRHLRFSGSHPTLPDPVNPQHFRQLRRLTAESDALLRRAWMGGSLGSDLRDCVIPAYSRYRCRFENL